MEGLQLNRAPVTFYLPGEADLERLRSTDPERDWREFQSGERCWIALTFLRLRQAGYPVELAAEPAASGLVVYHAKHSRHLLRHARRLHRTVLVGVRADNSEPTSADFEVVQNGVHADDRRRFFVPLWPQAALVPRDPQRGNAIQRVEFKGMLGNLHGDLRSPRWESFLADRGLQWVLDAVDFKALAANASRLHWNDFHATDLVLALRPDEAHFHTHKPATKLYNAWRAGVPALLGREAAFRELRRDPLDYIEVSSLAEIEAAIDLLRAEPLRYEAMVAHGRKRAEAFSPEAMVARWEEVLWRKIPALAAGRPLRHLPFLVRPLIRRARRLLSGRPRR